MTEEHLDILDDKGQQTGQVRSSADTHKEGLIHRTAHVWLLNSDKKLLLQKRASDKEAYPNYWDISAAGHISAGQTSIEAAQRETQEELGLLLSTDKFKYLFTVEEHIVLNQGTYINNEFQDVYLVQLDESFPGINLNDSDGEVSEIKWASIGEFRLLVNKEDSELVPHKEEYNRLVEYIS